MVEAKGYCIYTEIVVYNKVEAILQRKIREKNNIIYNNKKLKTVTDIYMTFDNQWYLILCFEIPKYIKITFVIFA